MQNAVKLAWHNRGYDDGFKQYEPREQFPDDDAEKAYIGGYRIGKRQRAAQKEAHVRDAS